jgi:hypothetical protein
VIWDEAFRRAAERGSDPEEHLRAMIQEVLDSLVRMAVSKRSGSTARERWSTGKIIALTGMPAEGIWPLNESVPALRDSETRKNAAGGLR